MYSYLKIEHEDVLSNADVEPDNIRALVLKKYPIEQQVTFKNTNSRIFRRTVWLKIGLNSIKNVKNKTNSNRLEKKSQVFHLVGLQNTFLNFAFSQSQI